MMRREALQGPLMSPRAAMLTPALALWLVSALPACLPAARASGAGADTAAASEDDGGAEGDATKKPDTHADVEPASTKGCTKDQDCADLPWGLCKVGSCDLVAGLCVGVDAADATPCTDGVCLDNAQCLGGVCKGDAKVCDDTNPCTDDACDLSVGCTAVANSALCDDGKLCTGSDHCSGGQCTGAAMDCDDKNPCTDDACNEASGSCTHAPTATPDLPCDNPMHCQENGVCKGGQCIGQKVTCDDKNPCTLDVCVMVDGSCQHIALQGTSCKLDVCNGGTCSAGTCVVKPLCEDNNVCTTDSCDPGTGNCVHKGATGPCDDLDPCTQNDKCDVVSHFCVGGAKVVCNDGNPCTNDTCEAGKGCVAKANAAPCNDGDPCTSEDGCAGGLCSGKVLTCDDGNACTVDACAAPSGCSHSATADGSACGAGTCSAGICMGKP